jgi:hypothetical protein
MGRHELSLNGGTRRVVLATGLYASTKVQTAFGWQAVADLHPGDLVMTRDDGLTPLSAIHTEFRKALWSVRLPAEALGNLDDMMLPPGQSVLVQTHYAMPFSGDDLALVPATALEGWHGIAPHVPANPETILQLRLPRPGILFAGPGLMVGAAGTDPAAFDLKSLLHTPSRPELPLAAARQMMAALVAEEASLSFRELHAADLRAPPNLS